jgi:hypothetical protein
MSGRTGRSDPNARRLVAALTPATSAGVTAPASTRYQQQYGLNYDPNYVPITGYQNMSYTDAMNQGYSPAMSEAAARGQGIPQYAAAAGPNIEDMDNLKRREAQGNGMGLFAGGIAGMLGAGALINGLGGAAASGAGSAAGSGAGAGTAGTAAGGAGSAAGAGAGAAGAAIPEGIEGVTVLGSSGAGAGAAGAAGGLGGAASMWDSVNQGAANTSQTNQLNDQQLQNMQAPSTPTDWSTIIQRAARGAGILNSAGSLTGGGGGARPTPGGGIQRNIPNPIAPVGGAPLPTGAPVPTNPALAWNPQTFGGAGGVGFRPTPQQNLQPIANRPYAAQSNAPAGTDGYYV